MNSEEFDEFHNTQASAKSRSRPFSQILQEIINHLAEIVRSEVHLARVEIRQDGAKFAKAGVFLAIGAVFALYALGFLLLGAVYALETNLAPWISAIIVGVAAGLIGTILLLVGRTKVKQADLMPDKTIASVRENVTWMKKQVR